MSDDAVVDLIRALNAASIPFMIVGSISSNEYGIPRSTKDADFVVDAPADRINAMLRTLPDTLKPDPQLSFESVTATTRQIIHCEGLVFEIEMFHLSADPHDQERFQRRIQATLYGQPVWLPTAEDVIITKLRWSKQGKRTKDVDDVRNVLAVQGDSLDFSYIHRWCDEHETRQLLEQIRATIPEGL